MVQWQRRQRLPLEVIEQRRHVVHVAERDLLERGEGELAEDRSRALDARVVERHLGEPGQLDHVRRETFVEVRLVLVHRTRFWVDVGHVPQRELFQLRRSAQDVEYDVHRWRKVVPIPTQLQNSHAANHAEIPPKVERIERTHFQPRGVTFE